MLWLAMTSWKVFGRGVSRLSSSRKYHGYLFLKGSSISALRILTILIDYPGLLFLRVLTPSDYAILSTSCRIRRILDIVEDNSGSYLPSKSSSSSSSMALASSSWPCLVGLAVTPVVGASRECVIPSKDSAWMKPGSSRNSTSSTWWVWY